MNFLRKRLFVFYGMLLVFSGGVLGGWIGSVIAPVKQGAAKRATDADPGWLSGQTIGAVAIAHVLIAAFAVYLHTRPSNSEVIGQRPRAWLMFTYGAYGIGAVLGAVLAIVMR